MGEVFMSLKVGKKAHRSHGKAHRTGHRNQLATIRTPERPKSGKDWH